MLFAAGMNFHTCLSPSPGPDSVPNLLFKLTLINSQKRNNDVVFPNLLYAEIDEDAVPAVAWVIFYESSGATRPADGSISSEFLPFQTFFNGQTGLGFINQVKFTA